MRISRFILSIYISNLELPQRIARTTEYEHFTATLPYLIVRGAGPGEGGALEVRKQLCQSLVFNKVAGLLQLY